MCSDELSRQHGFIGLIWYGEEASIVSIRIKLTAANEIEESEIVVGVRFPGSKSIDPKTLDTFRQDFGTVIPEKERHSREELRSIAASYYDGVNNCTPEKVPLNHEGSRVEMGTQISSNPSYFFEGYEIEGSNESVPNFAEWSAKEQFDRGLWNADVVTGERFPLVDVEHGLVFAYTIYHPWEKASSTHVEGVGKVRGDLTGEKVALCMTELFKIKKGEIHDMETVWFVGPTDMSSGW